MAGFGLNTFPNVLLIFNICYCLIIISLIFGEVLIYVTVNRIPFFRTALVLFNRVDLSRVSTFFYLVSNDVFFVPSFHESFNHVI